MNPSATSSRIMIGAFALLVGLLFEAAASVPLFAPDLYAVTSLQAILCHLHGAVLCGFGAAGLVASHRSPGQWLSIGVLFAFLVLVIPVAGLVAVFLLTLVLFAHDRRPYLAPIALYEVRDRDRSLEARSGFEAITQPLVSSLDRSSSQRLQQVTLGLESMPPRATRPLLKKLQKHPDVRVQLFANGLLNDQIDLIERRLAILKQRAADDPADRSTRLAIVETYTMLFDNHLVPSDEVALTANQALRETNQALSNHPPCAAILDAKGRFHLALAEYEIVGFLIEELNRLPGGEAAAMALHARMRYQQAAAAPDSGRPPQENRILGNQSAPRGKLRS